MHKSTKKEPKIFCRIRSKTGFRRPFTLHNALLWLERHYDEGTALNMTHAQRLAYLEPMIEGTTPQFLWDSLTEKRRVKLMTQAEARRAVERIQTQQVVETVTLTRDGNEMTIPLESFADAVDRAMVLARISAVSRIPASLEWFGQEIQIPVTYFEIPLTDDPRNVFNHLRYYGIMTEYDDGGFPCLIKPIILTKEEFSFYLMRAQKEHRPLFSILWERFGNQNNATPQPSPRTAHKGTTYVNITIPSYVLDYLALEAKGNGITLSRQCCQVLERYCKMKIRKAAKYAPAEIEKAEEDKQEKQE